LPRHPLHGLPQRGLPVFRLQNAEDIVATADDLATRNILLGFGSIAGASRFGWLLLELSRPWVARTEVDMESCLGFEGTGLGSAEMKIVLPGDHYWPPHADGSPRGHRL
jgi:hypothetical protein